MTGELFPGRIVGSTRDAPANTAQGTIQGYMIQGPKSSIRAELDEKFAMAVYTSGSSFDIVDNPHLQVLLHKIIVYTKEGKLPHYTIPTRKQLAGPLLDQAYETCAKAVKKHFDGTQGCMAMDSTTPPANFRHYTCAIFKQCAIFCALRSFIFLCMV